MQVVEMVGREGVEPSTKRLRASSPTDKPLILNAFSGALSKIGAVFRRLYGRFGAWIAP